MKNLQKRADQVDIGISAAAEATVDLLQGSIMPCLDAINLHCMVVHYILLLEAIIFCVYG